MEVAFEALAFFAGVGAIANASDGKMGSFVALLILAAICGGIASALSRTERQHCRRRHH